MMDNNTEGSTAKCNCFKSSDIDWTNRTYDTRGFDNRLADAYLGKAVLSDMSFLVELDNISIPAHAIIIASASSVLERCIFGTGSIVNTERVVRIRDCPTDDFKVLLRYLYTGREILI